MALTVAQFNKAYRYRAEKSDRWTILSEPPYEGDCEDYALTVLWVLAGHDKTEMARMVKRGDAYLYYTHTERGIGHMMLWVQDKGWIDCNHKSWSAEPHYPKEEKIGYLKYKFRMWWKGK